MDFKIPENKKKVTICLNMIVKNESHIIENTLEKLCNKVVFDYWVICDTGSTDNTVKIITEFFEKKGVKGEMFHDEWKNFAHNRTLALDRAYKKTDLLLVFDADDELVGDFVIPTEVLYDEYHLKFGSSFGTSYTRVLLINNHKRFQYLSVIHEFISSRDGPSSSTVVDGNYFVVSGRSGSRNQDPDKYLKDALVLEKAYDEAVKNKDHLFHRYAFYCANSFKDYGKFEESIKWYKTTLSHEHQWPQEKYVSCLYINDCLNKLDRREEGFFYLVKAFQYDNERVECLYPLLQHYCCENMPRIAYNYYLIVKDFFENTYLNSDESINDGKKLFVIQDKFTFFVPYYMILIADKVQDFQCVIKMFEIVFKKKQLILDEWYIKNLLYNLQFFLQYVNSNELTKFVSLANDYLKFLSEIGINIQNFDFLLKDEYRKFDINVEKYFIKAIENKSNNFSKKECSTSKNILIYTGFSDFDWNHSYMLNNALGGSEKAVAYLSKCFPKDYKIFISGAVANETIDNIHYINLRELSKVINETPFHTLIVSRYISFYEMFQNCSFYQSFIWAHDILLLPYGSNINENQILKKWDKYINGCICLTEWHRNLFMEKYSILAEKITLINNGLDLDSFKANTNNKIKNKFIYTSRPDRGLNNLLKLWPQILEKIPDAILTISSYGEFPTTPEDKLLKNIIDNTDSIFHLGKLSVSKLYEEMASSEFWLYPTHWPETSCITALEMLMSEVICLYYPIAGLTHTMDKYGIIVKPGSEIETIVSLTEEQKEELRKNGKQACLSCSWENRYQRWNNLLFPHYNAESKLIPNNNINLNIQLTIAIYNSFNFHYEMFGYIIYFCKKYNHKLTIFTPSEYSIGWLDFYKEFFKEYNFEYKSFVDFIQFKDNFDLIFVTTDDDKLIQNDWINNKYIVIQHTNNIRNHYFTNNLGIRPFRNNYIDWCIPCFPIFNKEDKINLNERENINIAIIGGHKDYNYNVINRLQSNIKINLFIIGRNCINFKTELLNFNHNNFYVSIHNNIPSMELFNIVNNCDYILTDCVHNYDHIFGISMSGCIPIAFSTLTPLIISKQNNEIYKFKNVVEFDYESNEKILIYKDVIDINSLIQERGLLNSMLEDYLFSKQIIQNKLIKNTALIVDPRDDINITYLIHDFQKKLGDNWIIVYYCGKGLKEKMSMILNSNIEVRELNVNNFTSNEYSDFMKSKSLWQTLYGDFVLTFQLDTYIINEHPLTIDYFINLNKSYIGGNMDHNWNELIREKLYPEYRNFNGGLSLRKRKDMIKIIETFGIEFTESNSNKLQTDAEDVYFTLGCYKLHIPIGDKNDCLGFCLNRIWTDKFFGIHKPTPQVLINYKELNNIYCKLTNRFILDEFSKPK
jgi:glycosyltransferase involved in cell wall biosynthesis